MAGRKQSTKGTVAQTTTVPKKSNHVAKRTQKTKKVALRGKELKTIENRKLLKTEGIRKRQSPIDICSKLVLVDSARCQPSQLQIDYHMGDVQELSVTSEGWRADVVDTCKTRLRAPHLPAEYRLAQFHAHWGPDRSCGSEHLVNGTANSGEVHFVFWNTSYPNFQSASTKPDGLAVVGVLLKETKSSPAYQIIADAVDRARTSDSVVALPKEFDMMNLIPEKSDYATYLGSLTTPPFSESVIWTVLTKPVNIGKSQLDVFRRITPSNYRNCQKPHKRRIYSSKKI